MYNSISTVVGLANARKFYADFNFNDVSMMVLMITMLLTSA